MKLTLIINFKLSVNTLTYDSSIFNSKGFGGLESCLMQEMPS